MVEENFKIGIELELEQESLAALTKQIEKAVKQATENITAGAARGGGTAGAAKPPVGGGTATGRSIAQAASVTQKDFTNAVKEVARENRIVADKFDSAAAAVVQSLDQLTKALERRRTGPAAAPAPPTVVKRAQGASNEQQARDANTKAQTGGRTPGSGGGTTETKQGRTGTKRDQPAVQREKIAQQARRLGADGGPTHRQTQAAEMRSKDVANSLTALGKELHSLQKLSEIPDLLRKVGLPTAKDVGVGKGASSEIKTLTGQTKTVTGYIRMVGTQVKESTNIVSKRIADLMGSAGFKDTLKKAERVAQKPGGEERALSMIRREIRSIFKLPTAGKAGTAQEGFQKHGETRLDIEFDKVMKERYAALKDDSSLLAALNKDLWEMGKALKQIAGVDVVGSVGLSEEHAADMVAQRGERRAPLAASINVQTRDIAGQNLGGRGGMRWARSFQPSKARPLVEGQDPRVMGRGERALTQAGLYQGGMTRNLKTGMVDPRKVPEVSEDMILIDAKAAAKMAMWEPKITEPIKELAKDLEAGQKLIHGQVIGTDIEGKEIKFDLHGAEAEIESIEEIVENGMKGHRIRLKELYEMKTGSKITTTGGFKGVVKVVENMAQKFGLAQGTEVAMTGHGAAKRGILGDVMKMMSTEIADKAEVGAQEVANHIEKAMMEGGQDLVAAVEAAAKAFGVSGFTGGQAGAKVSAMTGELPWMRLKEPREQGPAEMGQMYFDLPAMRSLQQRAGTDKMSEDMQANMQSVTASQGELILTLKALAGEADVASENLREMLPEDFKRLPPEVGDVKQMAGTILDPKFKEALAIRMPTRGGGESLMRMPAIDKTLGTRGGFETGLGAGGPEPITRQLDNILQQARQIRVAEGRVSPELGDLTEDDETLKDARYKTSRAIKDQVSELYEMGLATEEGAAAADAFVNSLLPLIDTLKLGEDISYYKLKDGERTTQKPIVSGRAGTSAADFVRGGKDAQGRLLRMQDVLTGRTGRKSKTTENIKTQGELWQGAETLQKVMGGLGITMEQSADKVEVMHSRLETLQTGLVKLFAVGQVMGSHEGGDPRRIPLAAQRGAGLSGKTHKELTAVQFRTDVDEELADVARILTDMGGVAGALTPELMEAMDAMDRIRGMQGDVAKIPRDAVLINEADWNNLVESTMKERGVDRGEAERRVQRTGLLQRYPVTGGASFLAAKAMKDPTGEVGAGKIGVAGPMAVSSLEDLAKMKAPLQELEQELYGVIQANNGQGEAAENARARLDQLVPLLGKLNQQFLSIGLNLDFDGDKIRWLADTATDAGSDIETFSDKVAKGGISFQQMMMNIMGGVGGGATGNVGEYAELFGKTAKLRSGEARRAIINPATGQMAEAEARAHTGGKMSVGLLTDAYNKMMLAVTEGTKGAGDAWATGLDYLMLNINKSLAQKGGGAGVAGPMEFQEDLREGNLAKIFKGMREGGGGMYGEMGDYNKQMREQMTGAFKGMYHRKGAQGLRDLAKAEGIQDVMPTGDITYENFVGVVTKMVDALDLEAVIRRMFDQMRDNMRRALQKEGMSGAELEQQMEAYAAPGEGGMDVDRMLRNLSPETQSYMLTRKKQVKEAREELTPMEAAQRAMKILPEHIARELATLEDEFSLEDKVDPKARAGEIAAELKAFYESVKDSFKSFARPEDLRNILPGGGAGYTEAQLKKVHGVHVPRKTPGGEKLPGEVYMSEESRVKPFHEAVGVLKAFSEGVEVTTEDLIQAAKQVREFGQTLAHEYVHRANKARGARQPVASMARSLGSAGTALGQDREKILEVMGQRANIGKLIAARKVATRRAEEQGIDPGDDPAVRDATRRLLRQVSEELMAYQTDPEFLGRLREAGVGEEAINEMKKGFDKLREKEPELIEAAMDVTRRASNAVLTGLMDGLEGKGSVGATGDIADALKGAFPGSDIVGAARGKLGSQEEVVMGGAGMLGLSRMARRGGKVEIEEPLAKTGFEEEFGITTSKIADIINTMRQSLPDPEILAAADKEIRQEARMLEGGIEAVPGGKGKGRQVYINTMREFHAAVSVGFINKARELEKQIAEARVSGKAELDPAWFRDLIAELYQTVEGHEEYLKRTLTTGGRGRGTVVSHIASAAGDLAPGAREAGIIPGPQMLEEQISRIAGEGAEGDQFLGQMGPSIKAAIQMLGEGEDHLKIWAMLFEALQDDPKMMHTNMAKVAEILGKVSRHLGFADGQFSDAATSALELAKNAKQIGRAIEGKDIKTLEDFLQVMQQAPKGAKMAALPGGGMTDSIEAQYENAEKVMKDYQKRLQKLIQSPGYKKAGAPRQFEPIDIPIVDPDTQKVFQKISIEARRMGKNIKVSMKQSGAATAAFGNQMRNAFRRVVQWGFASGIVYGVVRAFRAMVQIVTEVETKMTALKKVMDTSITDFEGMQDAAVGMAKSFGIAIGDVLDGMVVYGQQGLKMGEIMERTRATLMAVNVTTLTSTEATEALTAAHKVFGNEVDGSMGFVDAWGAVAAKHAITAKDLATAVQRSGAAAKTAGIGFNDFLGIVTAIGAVTRQTGKEIATSVKFMARAMRRPTAVKQLLTLDIQSEDVTGDLRPAVDVLGDVAKAWGGMNRAQQLSTAQAMAGIRHYNQFIVMMENWQEVLDASTDAANSQGFAMRKNALAVQTMAKQMERMKQTVNDLALSFGKALLPMATLGVKGITKLVDIFNMLPDIVKQSTGLFALSAVALTRVADVAVDTMDLLLGQGIGQQVDAVGFVGVGKNIGKALWRGVASVPAKLAVGAGKLRDFGLDKQFKALAKSQKGMKGMMQYMALREATEGMGTFRKSIKGVTMAFGGLWRIVTAGTGVMKALKVAMVSTGIGALVVALGTLVAAFIATRKSAKEYEDEMFDAIGKSQDVTSSIDEQATGLRKVSHAWAQYQNAMKKAASPDKLAEAVDANMYKSPLKALKEYKDLVADTGLAMATLDASKISGISETGDYLIEVGEGYDQLTASALDASKATTAALQSKVIKEYAKELTEATGWADNIKDILYEIATLGFGDLDIGVVDKIKDVRKEINSLTEQIDEMSAKGVSPDFAQEALTYLVGEELELRQQMVGTAIELKRVLETMPTFGDIELGKLALGGDVRKSIEAAIPTGVFGREATTESVIMSKLARTAGLGGVLGAESTAAPERLMQTMLEKGMRGDRTGQLTGKKTGALAVVDPEAVKAILALHNGTKALAKDTPEVQQAIQNARAMITTVDEVTGEVIYHFEDGLSGLSRSIRQSDLNRVLTNTMAQAMEYDRGTIDAAMQRTQKLLTLTFVGAMAGIRIPEGGMPDLGKALATEMSVEERVLGGDYGKEMQRLGEIQKEMTEIQRRYNESVGEGGELTEGAASAIKDNYKVLAKAQQDLVLALQLEAFDLSVVGHIDSAFHKLQKTLEDSARAARDAAIEEETRLQLLKHTSGALAGLPVLDQLDFGKGLKELSAQERLQKEMGPGYSEALAGITSAQKRYETQITTTTDIRKQLADFDEMIGDLAGGRGRLVKEQTARKAAAEAKGITPGEEEIASRSEDASYAIEEAVLAQTPLLDRIVMALDSLIQLEGMSVDEKKEFAQRRIGKMMGEEISRVAGKADPQALKRFLEETVGLRRMSKSEIDDRSSLQKFADVIGIGRKHVATGGTLGLEGESLDKYNDAADNWIKAMDRLTDFSERNAGYDRSTRSGENVTRWMNKLADAVIEAQNEILGLAEVQEPARRHLTKLTTAAAITKEKDEKKKAEARDAELRAQIEEMRSNVQAELTRAEQKSVAETEKTARLLQVAEQFRMAEAAQGVVDGMEDLIDEFEKTEKLFYKKIDSDLEGPFARVGKPGFKTDFERRREELDKGAGRPMSMADMRAREEERKKIDFDEKEAKIAQKQEAETRALRTQQQEAEKIREFLATQLMSGNLDPEAASMSERYLQTLTDQLATSEQAEMRGKDLYFEGVPALEDARNFLAKMQIHAKDQAKKAESAYRVGIGKKINRTLEDQGSKQITQNNTQIQLLQALVNQGAAAPEPGTAGPAAAGLAALPPGAVRGIPAIGATAGSGGGGATAAAASAATRRPAAAGPEAGGVGGAAQAGATAGILPLAAGLRGNKQAAGAIETALGKVVNVVKKLDDNNVTVISRLGDKIVGSQSFEIEGKTLKAQHIGNVEALPEGLQGQGIGTDRIRKMMEFAQEEGLERIVSNEGLTPAQARTYEKAAGGMQDFGYTPPEMAPGGQPLGAAEIQVPPRKGKYQGLSEAEMVKVRAAQEQPFHVESPAAERARLEAEVVEQQKKAQYRERLKAKTAEVRARPGMQDPFGEGAPLGEEALEKGRGPTTRAQARKIAEAELKAQGRGPGAALDEAMPTGVQKAAQSARKIVRAVALPAALADLSEALDITSSAGLKEDASEEGARMGGLALITALGALTLALGSLPVTIAAGVGIAAAAGADAFLGTDILKTGGRAMDELSGGGITDITKKIGDKLMGTGGVDYGPGATGSAGLESPAVAAQRKFLRDRAAGLTDATTRTTGQVNLTDADDGMGAAPADDVARHREFLRNREKFGGQRTRFTSEINEGKSADPNLLWTGQAPDDDVARHRQFLRDRAAGKLPADATRTTGQINQTAPDTLATLDAPMATAAAGPDKSSKDYWMQRIAAIQTGPDPDAQRQEELTHRANLMKQMKGTAMATDMTPVGGLPRTDFGPVQGPMAAAGAAGVAGGDRGEEIYPGMFQGTARTYQNRGRENEQGIAAFGAALKAGDITQEQHDAGVGPLKRQRADLRQMDFQDDSFVKAQYIGKGPEEDAARQARLAEQYKMPEPTAPAKRLGPEGMYLTPRKTAVADTAEAAGAAPYQPFESTRSTIDEEGARQGITKALAGGDRIFRPSAPGSFSANLADTSPQAYLEELQRQRKADTPQVGRSNDILQRDIDVNRLGDADAQDGGAPRNPERRTAQEEIEERESRPDAAPREGGGDAGSEEVKGAIETLCGKVEQIIAAIGGIGEIGGKIDAATTAVEAVPEQISLDGATVTVDNAAEIGSATGDAVNTNLGDVGAAVTDGITRIAELETLVGGEDVETRVATALAAQETAVAAQIAEGEAAAIAAAEAAAAEKAAEQVTSLNTQISELQGVRDTLESQANQQTGLIEQIENSIEIAKGDLEVAVTKAEDAATKAETAQENLDDVKENADAAIAAADEAKAAAAAAEAKAEEAEDTANAASSKTDQTKIELDQECVARENSERDIKAEAQRTDAKNQSQDTVIKKLSKDAAIALSNSKLALNKAGQK